jgi:hypothetical protein
VLQCVGMADPLVDALKALLKKRGRKAVADKSQVNDQTLYQIETGVLLKSGKPRGVGRALAEKLDRAYPGWRTPSAEPAPPPAGFADRHEVSASDWALLQDIKSAAFESEIEAIRKRAVELQRRVDQRIAELKGKL